MKGALLAAAAACVLVVQPAPASAAPLTPGCGAEIADTDATRSTRSDPVVVPGRQPVALVVTAPEPVDAYRVDVAVSAGPLTTTLRAASGEASGERFVEALDVPRFARLAVGISRVDVRATSSGRIVCAGVLWVRVAGNPVTTVAGVAASGLILAGIAGLVRAGRP